MRKINIGASSRWYKEGWEILDNGSGNYKEEWKHKGVAWDSKLPSSTYDILFTSHMLEHIPHFYIEKTIAEFNRILKIGGVVRISVPDLEKSIQAYIHRDFSFFSISDHPAEHLGIGSCLMNKIISPGHQTLALNKGFSEVLGSYAHLYCYDFEMIKILLEKWGFTNVTKSSYRSSSIEELRDPFNIRYKDECLDAESEPGEHLLKTNLNSYLSGFDNKEKISLFVEATKEKNMPYSMDNEFNYTKRNRFDDNKVWALKINIFCFINSFIDFMYNTIKNRK